MDDAELDRIRVALELLAATATTCRGEWGYGYFTEAQDDVIAFAETWVLFNPGSFS